MHDHHKCVLCVDDDWDACEACQTVSIFHPEIMFTFACDLEQGLNFIKKTGIFSMYLLDSRLPDGSGIELCRSIRKADANAPVVVLLREAYAGDRPDAMQAGASACLDKPAAYFHLEGAVTGLLRKAEARSLESRIIEIRAVRDSIRDCLSRLDGRLQGNLERWVRAKERLLRANAYQAFVGSGGARAHFEHLWPGVLSEVTTNTTGAAMVDEANNFLK